ncbi:hypothetical protein EVU91_01355 [Macrococcoides bohemicum]|uniref:hypothetical protein n=1 Tax=Macrococcoides bohemicum TaxID=1903056 RepID=UPI0010597024|nr:hypothetical protein [Macrococcus bohemicus]TDL40565.1 hypothetical protein EVU91_01355 [Macrococcus bohemicus]
MIEAQIGDYVKYRDDVLVIKKAYAHSFIGTSLNHKEDLVLGYNDITYLVEDDMYIEQKQRADELEKQNDILKHNIRVELDSNRNMYISMCEEKQRADRAEKRWSELKDFLLRYEDVPQSVQSFETVFEYMKEVERIEEDGE